MADQGAMKRVLEDLKKEQTAHKTQAVEQKQDKRFEKIQENTFAQIVFDPAKDLKQKKEAVVEALVADMTKTRQQNLERLEEFNVFKEYMQELRKQQNLSQIKSTSTDIFGRLQSVLDGMNSGVIQFEQAMEPLMKAVSAIHKLNRAGTDVAKNAYEEIKINEALNKEREEKLKAKQDELQSAVDTHESLKRRIYELQTDSEYRNFFGVIKGIYKSEIALKTAELPSHVTTIDQLTKEAEALKTPIGPETKFTDPEVIAAKEELANLLKLSQPEHKERQQALVDAALNFVNTNAELVDGIMSDYAGLKEQVEKANVNCEKTQRVYAVLTDAAVEVADKHKSMLDQYKKPTDREEGLTEQLEREEKKGLLDDYVTSMVESNVNTTVVSKELTEERQQLLNMRNTTNKQISMTRQIQSSGNAGIAGRLSATLSAINAAAIAESTNATRNTLAVMNDKTNAVMMNEAIRHAVGIREENDALKKAIDDLATLGEGVTAVTEMTRQNTAELLENQKNLNKLVEKTKEQISESREAVSKTVAEFNNAASNDNSASSTPASGATKKAQPKTLDMNNI